MYQLDVLIREALDLMDCDSFLSENLTDKQKEKLSEIKKNKQKGA